MQGGGHHHNRQCCTHYLDLCLACSNCLDDDEVVICDNHNPHDIAGQGCKASQVVTSGHAADKHHGITRRLQHANSITQVGAGKRAGKIGDNHAGLAVAAAQFSPEMRDKSTFASTGGTGHVTNMGVTGLSMQFYQDAAGRKYLVLDQCHHPRQRSMLSTEKAFNDVFRGTPILRFSGDWPVHWNAQTR
jgi:hypothetical protein